MSVGSGSYEPFAASAAAAIRSTIARRRSSMSASTCRFAQLLDIGLGALHVELRRSEEPVPARSPAGLDSGERRRGHFFAEQSHDPLHGAPEGCVEVRPAHRLPERDGGARRWARTLAEQFHRRAGPCSDAASDDVAPRLLSCAWPASSTTESARNADAQPFCAKASGGLRGLAVLEGGRPPGAR